MEIDALTANPATGGPGNLLNVKVDQAYAVVLAPVFTTDELVGINEAFAETETNLLAAFEPTRPVSARALTLGVQAEVRALAARAHVVLAESAARQRIAGGAIRDMLVGRGPGSLMTTLTAVARDVASVGPRRRAERLEQHAGRVRTAIEQAQSASLAILNVYYGNTNHHGMGVPNPDATADSSRVVRARQAELTRTLDQSIAEFQRTIWRGLAPRGRGPGNLSAMIQPQLHALSGRLGRALFRVPNFVPVVQTADDTPLMEILITEDYPGSLRHALEKLPASNPEGGPRGWAIRRFEHENARLVLSTFRRQMSNILSVAEAVLPPRRA
jgi:hypothetical protein